MAIVVTNCLNGSLRFLSNALTRLGNPKNQKLMKLTEHSESKYKVANIYQEKSQLIENFV